MDIDPNKAIEYIQLNSANYAKAKAENFNKDILYLRELEYFLISIREQTSGKF